MCALRFYKEDGRASVHEMRVLLLLEWRAGSSVSKSLATAFVRHENGGRGAKPSDPVSVPTHLLTRGCFEKLETKQSSSSLTPILSAWSRLLAVTSRTGRSSEMQLYLGELGGPVELGFFFFFIIFLET